MTEFDPLETAIRALPQHQPPAELDAVILGFTKYDQTPLLPPQSLTPPRLSPMANRRWWVAAVAVVAALALFLVMPHESDTLSGDPANFTERGLDRGLGPEVHLRMAVQDNDGLHRFTRGVPYPAGHTLLFKVDSPADGRILLLRISDRGVELLHSQAIPAGSDSLQTSQGAVGYELESGESAAVFAIVRFEESIAMKDLESGLPHRPDADAVCVAVRQLGGRCSAERVEGVQ